MSRSSNLGRGPNAWRRARSGTRCTREDPAIAGVERLRSGPGKLPEGRPGTLLARHTQIQPSSPMKRRPFGYFSLM